MFPFNLRQLLSTLTLSVFFVLGFGQPDSLIFNTTDSLFQRNKVTEAIIVIEDLLPKWEQNGKWCFYVRGLNRLVRYLESNKDIDHRKQLNQKAIVIAGQSLGDEDGLLGEAYQQQGEILMALGKLDSALLSLDQATSIFQNIKNWESYCWSMAVKTAIYYYQRKFPQAEEVMLRVLDIFRQQPDLDPEILNTVLQNLSVIYVQMGAYDRSLQLAQQAIEITLKIPNLNYSDSLSLTNRYQNLGFIYYEHGDYEEAIKNYKISLNLSLSLNLSDANIIELYNNIGNGLRFLGEYEQAKTYFLQSHEKVKNVNISEAYREVIKTLTFLGMVYMLQDKLEESLSFLQKAQTLSNRYEYNTNLVNFNLGRVYTKKKNWSKAISHLTKAEQLFQQEYGVNHHHTIITQRRIAEVYAEMNSLNQSLAYVEKALKSLYPDFNPEAHFDNPTLENFSAYTLLLPILEVKGAVLKKMYREDTESLKKVLETYNLASKTIEYIRKTQISESSKLMLSSDARKTYEGAIEILGYLFQQSGEKTYLEQAFTYMEKSRSLVLLENVRKYKEIQLNLEPQLAGDSVFQGLLAREKFLKREQVFFEKKLAEAQVDNDSAKIASLEKSLAEFYLEQQGLQTQFKDKYPTYYQVNYHTEVAGIQEIQSKLLSPGQALIEYFLSEKAMYVIRITQKKADFFHLPYHNDLDQLINQYRAAMVGEMYIQSPEKEFEQYTESAYALYQALVAPVLAELPNHIQHLYLIPDGKLNYISFESLLSQMPTTDRIDYSINHLDYLIKNKMISYGYSSTLLIEALSSSPENKKRKPYAGFAPVFAQNALATERNCLNIDNLEFLPNTEISVQNTHKLLGGKLFLRENASKDNFISSASDYHILHLSTHACVDVENPLFNRIFFARDHLSAYEIYNLNLSADLVVLSACETGFGNITQGEGVMSLARSFLYAGSKSIITSLWNADDYATTEIMLSFHKYLTEGKTKTQALHQAKLDYLTKNSPRLSPPYYWSNFVLVGNADSVEFTYFSWKYVSMGIMLLTLLGVIFFYFSNRKK